MKKGVYLGVAITSLIFSVLLGFVNILFLIVEALFRDIGGGVGNGFLFYIVMVLLFLPLFVSIVSLVSLGTSDPLYIFRKKINIFYFIWNFIFVILCVGFILLAIFN